MAVYRRSRSRLGVLLLPPFETSSLTVDQYQLYEERERERDFRDNHGQSLATSYIDKFNHHTRPKNTPLSTRGLESAGDISHKPTRVLKRDAKFGQPELIRVAFGRAASPSNSTGTSARAR